MSYPSARNTWRAHSQSNSRELSRRARCCRAATGLATARASGAATGISERGREGAIGNHDRHGALQDVRTRTRLRERAARSLIWGSRDVGGTRRQPARASPQLAIGGAVVGTLLRRPSFSASCRVSAAFGAMAIFAVPLFTCVIVPFSQTAYIFGVEWLPFSSLRALVSFSPYSERSNCARMCCWQP